MTNPGVRGILLAAMCCWIVATEAVAYEVQGLSNTGSVAGTVTLAGAIPEPKGFNLVTFPDPEYCGRISNGDGWRLLQEFRVDDQRRLQDVVVMLEGVAAGKPFDMSVPRVDARDCRFLPLVTVVRDDHGIEVVNMDPVMHDVQAYETSLERGTRVLFNSPLPMNPHHERGNIHATHQHLPGKSMVKRIHLTHGRRVFVMQCGFHAYMESWAIAVDNPYYTVTDASGQFVIEGIPPGTYTLAVWHPHIKHIVRRTVTIEPNQTLPAHVEMPAPAGQREIYRVVEHPRFTAEILGRPIDIIPVVQHQH